ncbi:hypothetical protein ElyMa_000613500 [Elysia marginata]|uniref:Uncharacterized protein n=1 Tax=Elysia marginata TaxID=1093978 RepID=A0AAV4G9H1_9GAST|nr:hypothetical protein ElyMa_000613500 [Elysia marginata]
MLFLLVVVVLVFSVVAVEMLLLLLVVVVMLYALAGAVVVVGVDNIVAFHGDLRNAIGGGDSVVVAICGELVFNGGSFNFLKLEEQRGSVVSASGLISGSRGFDSQPRRML